jgi:hypothetical protein
VPGKYRPAELEMGFFSNQSNSQAVPIAASNAKIIPPAIKMRLADMLKFALLSGHDASFFSSFPCHADRAGA